MTARQPFTVHRGRFIALPRAHIDTDAIMPARFLKRIERTGYGNLVFADWRARPGQADRDFPLDKPEARGATILVVGENFGCGSSREHAVWGLVQAGFRAVVAPRVGTTPGFADIFRNNAFKNGLLPVEVTQAFADRLYALGAGELTVDLTRCRVVLHTAPQDVEEPFSIPESARYMLLHGLDDIGLTLQYEEHIAAYERAHPELAPAEVPEQDALSG
ncbi:MAG: 3-isopropylmalate dehydratase small subunit [Gemmataceae bacterium]